MPNGPEPKDIDRFILEEIESVPHLEALLLISRDQEKRWSTEEMARFLYVSPESAQSILQDLSRRGLIAGSSDPTNLYYFDGSSEQRNALLRTLDQTYRRELIRISRMIHSKAASSVREFARAFRFTKEKD
jgi:DNA-binding MarR family transcriptional regulator